MRFFLAPRLLRYLAISALLILSLLSFRLVPHFSNFSPVGAMSLFLGALLGFNLSSVTLLLFAVFLSDLWLGFYPGAFWVYFAHIGFILWGSHTLAHTRSLYRVIGASAGGSITFFILSNFGVWAESGIYPLTLSGMIVCYIAALPFFVKTLVSTILFSSLLLALERRVLSAFLPINAKA